MERLTKVWMTLIIILSVVCFLALSGTESFSVETTSTGETGEVSLEVLNPRGVLPSTPIMGLTNPRVPDLNGKRIAILSEKEESNHFFNALEELIKKAYPTATIMRFQSPTNPMVPDNTAEVAEHCDVWLQGVKTSGSSEMDYDIRMEKHGKPGAPFCVDSLLKQRRSTESPPWLILEFWGPRVR